MDEAAKKNRADQLNPYNIKFWQCRSTLMPSHDDIREWAIENWKEARDPASINNRANQMNPDHIEFWRCRGFVKPSHENISNALNALVYYYKDRRTIVGELDLDYYRPLEAISKDDRSNSSDDEGTDLDDEMSRYMYQNSSRDVEQKTDENNGAGLGVLLGVGAVAGLAALGFAIYKNSRENEEEQQRRRAYQ